MITKIVAIQPIDLNKREQQKGSDYHKRKSAATFKDTLAAAIDGKVNIKI